MTALHQAAQQAVEALKLTISARTAPNEWDLGVFETAIDKCEVVLRQVESALQQQPEPAAPRFPTILRKMWSGGEVQAWIDEHWIAPPALQEVPREPVAEFEVVECGPGMFRMNFKDNCWWHKLPAGRYTLAASPSTTQQPSVAAHALNTTPVVDHATQQQEPQWGPILDALDGWSNDSRDEDYAHLARLVRTEHARTLDRIDATQQQEAGSGWRPIESAPKDGTHILAWTGASVAECRWYGRSGWGVATFNGQVWIGRNPSHWQPMPAAPSTPAREEAGPPAVDSQNPPADEGAT